MFATWLAACGGAGTSALPPFDPRALVLPDPADLPRVVDPPDVLRMWSEDLAVDDAETWWTRRAPELALLLAHYEYGRPGLQGEPFSPPTATVTSEERGPVAVTGMELVRLGVDAGGLPFEVDLFVPTAATGPVAVVAGLNKCGLASLVADPTLPLPTAFVQDDCPGGATEAARGSRANYWDLEACAVAGVAVATVHQSEFAPDDPELPAPIEVLASDGDDPEARWGAVAQWAAGLRLLTAVLRERPELDAERIVVFGHSRRGKAALWAGATDPSLPIVWAHQSGTGGATLSRSYAGEPVAAVNLLYPHWFAPHFAAFGDREEHLPTDQHGLLALLAPRPVWLSDGTEDLWADPDGAQASVDAATPVFDLLGAAPPVHHLRPGVHEVNAEDWAFVLDRIAAL